MSKKGGGGGEAAAARADEQARQQRIREGTSRVNSIFDGGTSVSGRLADGAAFDPKATYYRADGSVFTPPNPSTPAAPGATGGYRGPIDGSGRSKDSGPARLADIITGRAAADPWKGALAEGLYTTKTQGKGAFNEDFFEGQKNRYIEYAMPQVEEQRGQADKELLFAMARGGQTQGSVRADLAGELQKKFELQSQKVRDDGLAYSTQARNNVESARTDLISMLNATGDAEGAASSALARSAALSQPAAYSPIGNLFADFTGALGTQAAAERARYYGGAGTPGAARYETGLFAPRSGAVAVT